MKKRTILITIMVVISLVFISGCTEEINDVNSIPGLFFDGNGGNDDLNSIAIDPDGYLFVVGGGWNLFDSIGTVGWIKKFDPSGNELWEKIFEESGEISSATCDNNGNIYLVGTATLRGFWWIKKLDSNGDEDKINWNKSFYDGHAQSVVTDTDVNVYIAGYGSGMNPSTGNDWWIKKFDANGNEDILNWNKTFDGNGSTDIVNSIATDTIGNVYVAGYGSNLIGSTFSDWWIKKFDTTGNELWQKQYDGNGGPDSARCVVSDSHGNVYIAGDGTDIYNEDSSWDYWVMKINSSTGEREWERIFDLNGSADQANSIKTDINGDIYIGGTGINSDGSVWWIIKLDSDGNQLWEKTFDVESGLAFLSSVATDLSGNLYSGGSGTDIKGSNTLVDWWIMKLNSDGNQLWQ